MEEWIKANFPGRAAAISFFLSKKWSCTRHPSLGLSGKIIVKGDEGRTCDVNNDSSSLSLSLWVLVTLVRVTGEVRMTIITSRSFFSQLFCDQHMTMPWLFYKIFHCPAKYDINGDSYHVQSILFVRSRKQENKNLVISATEPKISRFIRRWRISPRDWFISCKYLADWSGII